MNICVVGWYGSETLGDRAILIGISKVIEKSYGKSILYLGSLYPFYSKRCIYEDQRFYKEICPSVELEIFDILNKSELKDVIKKCDVVAMGGGPIMDLMELGIIEYSFSYAKRKNKKTALIGCGFGPFLNNIYKRISTNILSLSDLIIFRDPISSETAKKMVDEYKLSLSVEPVVLHDPAIISVGNYIERESIFEKTENVLVNLREYPEEVFQKENKTKNDSLVNMIVLLSKMVPLIKLLPMHNFFHGGDDRKYLSSIRQKCNRNNIIVLHQPLSVNEMFREVNKAYKCIGMRYHAVVFQTLINGENAILDYTQPKKGKISGFLKNIDAKAHYKRRYLNIQECEIRADVFLQNLLEADRYIYNNSLYTKTERQYVDLLNNLISG